jgi:hypothetical protein
VPLPYLAFSLMIKHGSVNRLSNFAEAWLTALIG